MERSYLIWSEYGWLRETADCYTRDITEAGVFTDRKIKPNRERKIYFGEASSEIMRRRGELIRDLARLNEVEEAMFGGAEEIRLANIRNLSVEELEFSVRTSNCLRNEGITTIGELTAKSKKEMLAMQHFGLRSLNEVVKALDNLGIKLRGETT